MNRIELPTKYYLSHFQELKSVLRSHYETFFETSHVDFLTAFDSFTEDAQCLYLRMMNRKGKFFFTENLQYAEITSFDEALKVNMKGLSENLYDLISAPRWE